MTFFIVLISLVWFFFLLMWGHNLENIYFALKQLRDKLEGKK